MIVLVEQIHLSPRTGENIHQWTSCGHLEESEWKPRAWSVLPHDKHHTRLGMIVTTSHNLQEHYHGDQTMLLLRSHTGTSPTSTDWAQCEGIKTLRNDLTVHGPPFIEEIKLNVPTEEHWCWALIKM